MNYYEHHLGDYMRDTAHLSILEDGTYRRLIDAYYVRERPLPLDLKECCKLARASSKPEREAVAYVLKEFFEKTPEGYRQKRCDEVLAKYRDRKYKAAASANARWSQCERNANASETDMRSACEVDAPNPQSPVTKKEEAAAPLVLHESLPKPEWDEWLTHRREKRWSMSPRALKPQLKLLSKFPTQTQREIIETSLQAGWQGLFEPKGKQAQRKPDPSVGAI